MRKSLDTLKNLYSKVKKPMLKSLVLLGYLLALVFLFVLIININIVANTKDEIYSLDQLNSIESEYDCILILGAGVRADASPTPMLRDRLRTGLISFEFLKTSPIFISGDSESNDYQETVTMRNVLLENGVSEDMIISDGYGLSTYESIWRAKNVYGFDKILIVSQKYHLHRAIYIAHELGLEADGVDAALTSYGKQPYYSFREYLARIKDMLFSEIMPNPKYTELWEER